MSQITAVEPQQRDPKRVSVFLDHRFWLGMPRQLLAELGLQVGLELDRRRIRDIEERVAREAALGSAVQLLNYRDRSAQEIRQRLQRKGYTEQTVEQAVEVLQDYGMLDDARFAEQLIEAQQRKGRSRRATFHALLEKGVGRDLAAELLDRFYPPEQEPAVALAWASRRWKGAGQWPRLQRQLASRGFDWEVIRTTFRALSDET